MNFPILSNGSAVQPGGTSGGVGRCARPVAITAVATPASELVLAWWQQEGA